MPSDTTPYRKTAPSQSGVAACDLSSEQNHLTVQGERSTASRSCPFSGGFWESPSVWVAVVSDVAAEGAALEATLAKARHCKRGLMDQRRIGKEGFA